jgi:DNA-binding response OmpR family regulator
VSKKILITDDEVNIVTALQFVLERGGYLVRVAGTGDAVLREMEEFAPDLVLLDIMMPGLNGYEACQRIRQNPAWQGVKIVMLTAKGRDVDVTKGLAMGADAYVTKPFSTKGLLAQVKQLLGESP